MILILILEWSSELMEGLRTLKSCGEILISQYQNYEDVLVFSHQHKLNETPPYKNPRTYF